MSFPRTIIVTNTTCHSLTYANISEWWVIGTFATVRNACLPAGLISGQLQVGGSPCIIHGLTILLIWQGEVSTSPPRPAAFIKLASSFTAFSRWLGMRLTARRAKAEYQREYE